MKKQLLAFSIVLASAAAFAQSPRLSLFEEFTGETCGPCAQTNPQLNITLHSALNSPKVVAIKWQVPIPSAPTPTWSLYKSNLGDIVQREAYYPSQNPNGPITSGINSAPQGRFDGQHQWAFGVGSDHPANVTDAVIATAQSYTSAFTVTMAKELVQNNSAINVTVNIVATAPFTSSGTLCFRTVMVDKFIQFATAPGTNGETQFEDVAVKSFPNITNGTALPATWVNGQIRTFILTCAIPSYILNGDHGRSIANIDLVGFIQDNGNKKVAQAARAQFCSFVYATASSSVVCEAGTAVTLSGDGADFFDWSTGQTGSSIVVTPTETTTYWIESTDPNSCANRSAVTVSVSNCTGIQQVAVNKYAVEIYPNPSKGDFLVKTGFSTANTSLLIYNAVGQKVFEEKLNGAETTIKTNLSKGLYIYKIVEGSEKVNAGKLVIE